MARNRHNAAFVVGSVLGGIAGAAVALWKTPYSGAELRSKLTGGTATGESPRYASRMLSSVEQVLAPVVGVKLGKTANEGEDSVVMGERAVAGERTMATSTSPVADADQPVAPDTEANAATVEQLTHPQVDVQPEALREEEGEMKPFPKLGGNEPLR